MSQAYREKWYHLLNLRPSEWSRVSLGWIFTFILRFGFILGWTILLAHFMGVMGVQMLPLLFFLHALAMMAGAIFFQGLLRKINGENLLIASSLLGVLVLIVSLFVPEHPSLFLGALFFVESIIMGQVSILISILKEDLFSPLESQRTLPVMESAETLGGVSAGLLLAFFSGSWSQEIFIVIWAFSLLCLAPILFFYRGKIRELSHIKPHKDLAAPKGYRNFKELKSVKYFKYLMILVALHWAASYLIEYRFTEAIEQDVSRLTDGTHSNFEALLLQKIGILQLFFSSIAFFVQILFSSRILNSLGVIWSLLLHPLVTVFGVLGLSFQFNLWMASSVKGSFEITRLIFKSGYDASYYAFPRPCRSSIKEILDGFVKPLGVLLGTLLIFIVSRFIPEEMTSIFLNLVLLLLLLFTVHITLRLNETYTYMGEYHLTKKMDLGTRLNAIEILGQNGHSKNNPALYKLLKRSNESALIKVKIIESLALRQETDSIGILLACLKDSNLNIRTAAAHALSRFKIIRSSHDLPFTFHRIQEALEEALIHEENDDLKQILGSLLYHLDRRSAIRFFMKIMSEDDQRRAGFIKLMKLFPDPHLFEYLEPYLKSKNPKIKAATIQTLWPLKQHQKLLEHHLKELLQSSDTDILLLGIQTCGEVSYKESLPRLYELLNRDDEKELHGPILASLAQMGEERIIPHLMRNFLGFADSLYKFPQQFREKLECSLHLHITEKLHHIFGLIHQGKASSKEWRHLHELKEYYQRIRAHHEAAYLEELMDYYGNQRIHESKIICS